MPRLIGAVQTASFASKTTTFTSSTTFTAPPVSTSVTYLVVAGGGGGGIIGGGGGAGGLRSSIAGDASGGGASAEPALTITAGSDIPVVVGAGGPAPAGYPAPPSGNASNFGPISSVAGGAGAQRFAPGPVGGNTGGPGGSAGGHGGNDPATSDVAGTANQGFWITGKNCSIRR